MRNFTFHVIGTIVLSVLIVCIALGGGYQLNEQGARAVGMGGAFVARASDPSAIYFNPAGLAFQSGINVLGGANIILPSTKFTDLAGVATSTNSQVFTPVNLYGTYQLSDQFVVGLGIFNPFGLGTEWPATWEGRQLAIKSDIQTWYFNPTASYKISDQLSVGLGLSYIYGKVTITRSVTAFSALTPAAPGLYIPTISATDGLLSLDGTGTGFGFNFGAIYKPMSDLSIGLSFRSETKLEFSGNANFSNMLASTPYFPGGTGKATLPMPMNIYVGAAYNLMPDLAVEVDFQYVGWSSYKDLSVTIPSGPPINLIVAAGPPPVMVLGKIMQQSATEIKDWNDGYLIRGGVEYKMDSQVSLRGGLILDVSPQPPSKTEPMLPDGDRVDITLGGSYKISDNFSVDVSYMLVLFMERDAKTSELPGTYNSNAHIFSLDLGYSF